MVMILFFITFWPNACDQKILALLFQEDFFFLQHDHYDTKSNRYSKERNRQWHRQAITSPPRKLLISLRVCYDSKNWTMNRGFSLWALPVSLPGLPVADPHYLVLLFCSARHHPAEAYRDPTSTGDWRQHLVYNEQFGITTIKVSRWERSPNPQKFNSTLTFSLAAKKVCLKSLSEENSLLIYNFARKHIIFGNSSMMQWDNKQLGLVCSSASSRHCVRSPGMSPLTVKMWSRR